MAIRRSGLATRRRAQGYTQEKLAELLAVERTTVARWEAGETTPQPWVRPRLAQLLGVRREQLDTWLGDQAPTPLRNELDIEALRDHIESLMARYEHVPSVLLLTEAGQCLTRIRDVRRGAGRADGVTAARLEALASVLMSQLVWDASLRREQRTARAYLGTAVEAARSAGDTETESRAWLRASFLSLYGDRDPRAGLRLARRAVEAAGSAHPAAAGWGLLHEAEAYASVNDARACEEALAAARNASDECIQVLQGQGSLDETSIERLAGSCLISLNRCDQAEKTLAAIAGRSNAPAKADSIVWGNLALSLCRQDRLEESAHALHSAIDIVETTRSGGGMSVVFAVGRELAARRAVDDVRDVWDRLLSLVTA